MNRLFFFYLAFASVPSSAQQAKPVSVHTSYLFGVPLTGLGNNDGGFGINAGVSFFGKHRLQLLTEGGIMFFLGDKTLFIDSLGRKSKSGAAHFIQAGPQVFIGKSVAIAATAGLCWYRIYNYGYETNLGLKYTATWFPGKERQFLTTASFAQIPLPEQSIGYLSIGLGFRF